MLMKKNGKYSYEKKTRYIDMFYFVITDRIENKEVSIEYRNDRRFFCKPLQVSLLHKFAI